MKPRSKLVLLSTALCVSTVAAVGVSTYAFFFNSPVLDFRSGIVTVEAIHPFISADLTYLNPTFTPHNTRHVDVNPEEFVKEFAFSDVTSPDGENFYRYDWDTNEYVLEEDATDYYKFNVDMKCTAFRGKQDLFISANALPMDNQNSHDKRAAQSIRYLITEKTDDTYETPIEGESTYFFVSNNTKKIYNRIIDPETQEYTTMGEGVPAGYNFGDPHVVGEAGDMIERHHYFTITVWFDAISSFALMEPNTGRVDLRVIFGCQDQPEEEPEPANSSEPSGDPEPASSSEQNP